jgi:hypothetical protein
MAGRTGHLQIRGFWERGFDSALDFSCSFVKDIRAICAFMRRCNEK